MNAARHSSELLSLQRRNQRPFLLGSGQNQQNHVVLRPFKGKWRIEAGIWFLLLVSNC
jgi:hypothetical protein